MSVFTMVVLIVAIVTIGRIYDNQQKAKRRISDGGTENRRLEAEITRLNERIAVLERLATDPSKRLADEIDSLKAVPPKSAPPAAPSEETDNGQR